MRKRIFFVLTVCWMLVIFSFSARNAQLSTQDSTSLGIFIAKIVVPGFHQLSTQEQAAFADRADHFIRKSAHMTEYAILGVLLVGSFLDKRKKRLKYLYLPFCIGAGYAVTDEVHQIFVPGRSCQVTDMLIDSCGVIIGVLFARLMFELIWRGWAQEK